MAIRIVTDSAADLDADVAARHQITVVPLFVHFGDEAFQDGATLSKADFYKHLVQSSVFPRTSQPSAGTFQEAYAALSDADGIVSIHVGAKLSGTTNAARAGAALLPAGSPPVEVVDSNQASLGLGYTVLAAAEAAAAGSDAAGIVAAARECAARARVLLFVDTLEHLQKGGRIGRARTFLGTLLRTKPVLELIDGEIDAIERPRTRQKAIDRLHSLAVSTPRAERIAVLYTTTPDDAERLAGRMRETLAAVPVSVVQISPVIGAHVGPGALGAAVLQAPA